MKTKSVEEVWSSWGTFGELARFHPGIKASRLLAGSLGSGVGALRQCDLSDGCKEFVRRKINAYDPPHRMVIDIYEATVPIRSAQATLKLTPIGADQTRVSMTMVFTPEMGLLGRLMSPMMTSQFKSMLGKVRKCNSDFVTRGVEVVR